MDDWNSWDDGASHSDFVGKGQDLQDLTGCGIL